MARSRVVAAWAHRLRPPRRCLRRHLAFAPGAASEQRRAGNKYSALVKDGGPVCGRAAKRPSVLQACDFPAHGHYQAQCSHAISLMCARQQNGIPQRYPHRHTEPSRTRVLPCAWLRAPPARALPSPSCKAEDRHVMRHHLLSTAALGHCPRSWCSLLHTVRMPGSLQVGPISRCTKTGAAVRYSTQSHAETEGMCNRHGRHMQQPAQLMFRRALRAQGKNSCRPVCAMGCEAK